MYDAHNLNVRLSIAEGTRNQTLLQRLLAPESGLIIFCVLIAIFYIAIPLIASFFAPLRDEFILLAIIAFTSILSIMLGSCIPLFDSRFNTKAPRLFIDVRLFQSVVWTLFIGFLIITFYSAKSIPLITAIKGASANVLSQERGDFLKSREGAWIILLYLSTLLTSMLVPYSLVLLYSNRITLRKTMTFLFFIFCICSLQKALFLNLLIPMIIYYVSCGLLTWKRLGLFFSLSVLLLIYFISLSVGNDVPILLNEFTNTDTITSYFSANYRPNSSLDYFLWRVFSVPIFTAADTLIVFSETFHNQPLLGATSSLLAMIFGLDRVNIERYVFEYQFGSWNDIANANAVFFTDAYVNFGWGGVFFIGLLVGQVFRLFRLSKDIGFRSLWPLFSFFVFSASFIGILFSNGFLYMIFQALFIKIKPYKECSLS